MKSSNDLISFPLCHLALRGRAGSDKKTNEKVESWTKELFTLLGKCVIGLVFEDWCSCFTRHYSVENRAQGCNIGST